MEQSGDFNDKVKDLEAKFTSNSNANATDRKPKVGKQRGAEWWIKTDIHTSKFPLAITKKTETENFPLQC